MMIKKFNCLQCNYQTDLPSNFKRHKQTIRHQNNLKNYSKNNENPPLSSYIHLDENQTENTLLNSKIIKCDHCNTIYTTKYNLNRHDEYRRIEEDFHYFWSNFLGFYGVVEFVYVF